MKEKILTGIVAALLALTGWLSGHQSAPVGSVGHTNEYRATTTSSTSACPTASFLAVVGPATLGSIVVNNVATAGYVRVWNATSTATSSYATTDETLATATFGLPVARLKTTAVENTYTYDIVMSKGIVIETSSGFDGNYTITYHR